MITKEKLSEAKEDLLSKKKLHRYTNPNKHCRKQFEISFLMTKQILDKCTFESGVNRVKVFKGPFCVQEE